MGDRGFDLVVAYRVYPGISRDPVVFSKDKFSMARLAVRSFRKGLGGLRAKVKVMLDGCPEEYGTMFRDELQGVELEVVKYDGLGNGGTFLEQVRWLAEQEEGERVFFAEDDYFYLPGALEEMVRVMKDHRQGVDFLSPFDHGDYYHPGLHDYGVKIRFMGQRHWRDAASSCLTFMTHRAVLREVRWVFETYGKGNLDVSLWMAVTRHQVLHPWRWVSLGWRNWRWLGMIGLAWWHGWRRILWGRGMRLWVPMPSLGTHLERSTLAPGVDWKGFFREEGVDECEVRGWEDCHGKV